MKPSHVSSRFTLLLLALTVALPAPVLGQQIPGALGQFACHNSRISYHCVLLAVLPPHASTCRATAAQVKPAPNEARTTMSPMPKRFCCTASSKAKNTEAADVLPYRSILTTTRSGGNPNLLVAASIIRRLA